MPPDSAVLNVTCPSSRPITVQVELNGQLVPMELDTGASVSLISHSPQQRLLVRHWKSQMYASQRTQQSPFQCWE